MARLKNCFFGKLISAVSQYDKKPYEDWRINYTGQEGLILLFQSMHNAPLLHDDSRRKMDAFLPWGLGAW